MAEVNQFILEAFTKVVLPEEPNEYLELNDVIQITISSVGSHTANLEKLTGVNFMKHNFMWLWEKDSMNDGKPICIRVVNSLLEQIKNDLGYKEVSNVVLFHTPTLIVKEMYCFEKIEGIKK